MPYVLEDFIRDIKLWNKFLAMIFFEGSLVIWLEMKKHLIPFNKMAFITKLISLLLHEILSHDHILFEGA